MLPNQKLNETDLSWSQKCLNGLRNIMDLRSDEFVEGCFSEFKRAFPLFFWTKQLDCFDCLDTSPTVRVWVYPKVLYIQYGQENLASCRSIELPYSNFDVDVMREVLRCSKSMDELDPLPFNDRRSDNFVENVRPEQGGLNAFASQIVLLGHVLADCANPERLKQHYDVGKRQFNEITAEIERGVVY